MQGRYGGKFHSGFAAFLKSGELTDVQVVVGSTHYHAHMLLLAYHSEFFRRAVTSHFREGKERVIHLGIDDPAAMRCHGLLLLLLLPGVWPTMLEFFYSDELVLTRETVLPMLALARQLMVKSIEDWCMDFAQNSLETGNAIQYLNQAVQFNCDSFRDSCVTLVAEGFPASFSRSTDGLPTEVMLEVLQHPRLLVQTEEQVLVFVLNYVARHELSADTRHQLFSLVRLPFLSNDRLAQLTLDNEVPKDLLLPALAFRLTLLDRPDRMASLAAAAATLSSPSRDQHTLPSDFASRFLMPGTLPSPCLPRALPSGPQGGVAPGGRAAARGEVSSGDGWEAGGGALRSGLSLTQLHASPAASPCRVQHSQAHTSQQGQGQGQAQQRSRLSLEMCSHSPAQGLEAPAVCSDPSPATGFGYGPGSGPCSSSHSAPAACYAAAETAAAAAAASPDLHPLLPDATAKQEHTNSGRADAGKLAPQQHLSPPLPQSQPPQPPQAVQGPEEAGPACGTDIGTQAEKTAPEHASIDALVQHAVFVQGMGWVSRNLLPRRTYTSILHYGLPGGSEFACVPLHEVWEELVPQLHVRVSGDVVEGDAESILRVHDQDSAWFVVSGDSGQQPVWIEVELPPNMRVVELQRYTFSHGMNFANHMLPYGISDSAWFQMKGLVTQVSAGEGEPFYTLRTSESSTMQFEYAVSVEEGQATAQGASGSEIGAPGRGVPAWRRLRITSCDQDQGGSVRLSLRKLRLYGYVEISLLRPGPLGAKDLLAVWQRKRELASLRGGAVGEPGSAAAGGAASASTGMGVSPSGLAGMERVGRSRSPGRVHLFTSQSHSHAATHHQSPSVPSASPGGGGRSSTQRQHTWGRVWDPAAGPEEHSAAGSSARSLVPDGTNQRSSTSGAAASPSAPISRQPRAAGSASSAGGTARRVGTQTNGSGWIMDHGSWITELQAQQRVPHLEDDQQRYTTAGSSTSAQPHVQHQRSPRVAFDDSAVTAMSTVPRAQNTRGEGAMPLRFPQRSVSSLSSFLS
ncbi:hypothetical protein QJQ45_016458 [Haematococcus lacustris]|nr:hypothetical protein QJQ45_016458 [Haematococcus lacustris]